MFKKITAFVLLVGLFLSSTYAYTSTDVDNANFLADQGIIKDWSDTPVNYHLENYISRVGIMAMLLTINGITLNSSCDGDFSDVQRTPGDDDWTCRVVETAADRDYIYAQRALPSSMRETRPYDKVTRAEALGIFMKAFPNLDDSYTGFSYYWDANFPNEGDSVGYNNAYSYGAQWQAAIFYSYIRKVLQDDAQLRVDPRASSFARIKEVFEFATNIMVRR